MRGKKALVVALGPHRVRAVEHYASQLTAQGALVEVIAADLPEWAAFAANPGVTVHKVGPDEPDKRLRMAKRWLRGRPDLLRDADLLVIGDPYALPVAWTAVRQRPDIEVRLDYVEVPGREPAPADLAVVTPWYPGPDNAFAGAFVKAALDAVRDDFGRVSVLHTEDWAYRFNLRSSTEIALTARRLIARTGNAVVADMPGGEVTRVVVPMPNRQPYSVWAKAHLEALRKALPTNRIEAPVVHAHAGIFGGVAAVRLARPDARIIVTEHATFLPKVLEQPGARRLYREVLERADVFVCVSRYLYDLVQEAFPRYSGKLRIIPNVVDFDRFTIRPEPPRNPLRWLYAGRLHEQKGVHLLVEAFARVLTDEPEATLTLVGSGPLEGKLRERIRDLGLADKATIHPAVPPEEMGELLHRHDVLVHPSRLETFGMTVVEAVATGTPVLVAGSAGPRETLAGLEGTAGFLFEVSDDPEVIVDGYRKLKANFDTLDLAAARGRLLARYGRDAVAAQLLDAYGVDTQAASERAVLTPRAEAVPSRTGAGRILLVSTSRPGSFNAAREFAEREIARGIGIDVITDDPDRWRRARLDGDVRIHGIRDREMRRLLPSIERLLVYRVPGKAISLARGLARRSDAVGPEIAVIRLQRMHKRFARAIDGKVFQRVYMIVRPRLLWRVVRRHVLPTLDLTDTRAVVIIGLNGVTTGSRLSRRYPHLTVTTSTASLPFEPTEDASEAAAAASAAAVSG